jgi:hypothetical protein
MFKRPAALGIEENFNDEAQKQMYATKSPFHHRGRTTSTNLPLSIETSERKENKTKPKLVTGPLWLSDTKTE